MEFLDGGTLRDLLRSEGPLDPGAAASLVRQVALGLDAVHGAGVVHRDVKPDNIALPRGGVAKLMDFGAAARISATATANDVLGTLGYLAPEQARVPPTSASDLYALGVVFYELLAGHRPHDGMDIASLMARVLESDVPPLERQDVPAEIAVLLARMLSREPGTRPTAAQVAASLEPHAVEVGWTVPSSRAALPSDGGPTVRSHAGNVLALLRLY